MPQYEFCVDLRIFHPALKSDEITKALSQEPDRSHNHGELRVSKNGRQLGGVYEDTFWSIDLCKGQRLSAEDILFEDFIKDKNKEFYKHSDFFKKLNETGGSIEYFVGWFSLGSINMNIFLEPSLMKETSELGVTVILCAYPENE